MVAGPRRTTKGWLALPCCFRRSEAWHWSHQCSLKPCMCYCPIVLYMSVPMARVAHVPWATAGHL